ncbi:MAG: HD domain-containing protein [Oscillospiraceae bacterium]
MKIEIPPRIMDFLRALWQGGFDAYIVGGCVRDNLLGKIPSDYDITTNATPDEMKACFSGFKVFETGLKHGTLTVYFKGISAEITTFRIDGEYSDHRRPDGVFFTKSLKDDLARRDFTINSMAYSGGEIVDFFGGKEDISNEIIRCVGDAQKRFSEDALRIMRAIRFAAALGFSIEEKTENALILQKSLLNDIAVERFSAELVKLICGDYCYQVLEKYVEIISEIIPEIKPCIGFEQRNKYHKYTVWGHIIKAVAEVKNERILRLTMLFHDIGKPLCMRVSDDGQGHFGGHEEQSAAIAGKILRRLKFDKDTISRVCLLIRVHHLNSECNSSGKTVKKILNELGTEAFFQLLEVQRADAKSKQDFCRERLKLLDIEEISAKKILENGECFSLKQLAIKGGDLINLGVEPCKIGEILENILGQVINEKVPNERETLMKILQSENKI